MSHVATTDVEVLRKEIAGEVLVPGDEGYDQARVLWNGSFDLRPGVVVRCAGPEDVSAAILFARDHQLEIAVRGGAHSTGGMSGVDGGLQIDLSLMQDVAVDPVARTCAVGGGATLAQRDGATQEHGLATTAGIVGHTGVGGLTLGGGMGWLTRKHGLAVDNLLSAEVVTADGRVRQVSRDAEPDLFWAIRGGGGNFGVVTRFDFRLHPVGPWSSSASSSGRWSRPMKCSGWPATSSRHLRLSSTSSSPESARRRRRSSPNSTTGGNAAACCSPASAPSRSTRRWSAGSASSCHRLSSS